MNLVYRFRAKYTAFSRCSTSRSRPASWIRPCTWNNPLLRSHAVLKGGADSAIGAWDNSHNRSKQNFTRACNIRKVDPIDYWNSIHVFDRHYEYITELHELPRAEQQP